MFCSYFILIIKETDLYSSYKTNFYYNNIWPYFNFKVIQLYLNHFLSLIDSMTSMWKLRSSCSTNMELLQFLLRYPSFVWLYESFFYITQNDPNHAPLSTSCNSLQHFASFLEIAWLFGNRSYNKRDIFSSIFKESWHIVKSQLNPISISAKLFNSVVGTNSTRMQLVHYKHE